MWESGYYPPGAEHDPNAPWNQVDPDIEEILELEDGELILIERWDVGPEDWEEEKHRIDGEYFDRFACKKLGLDFEELWNNEEIIEIKNVEDIKGGYKFITSKGEFETYWDELMDNLT